MGFNSVLITGCGGMLGHAVYPFFKERFATLVATDKDVNEPWLEHLDIRDRASVEDVFERVRPDLVLHLAAETCLEFCESNPDVAEATNARGAATVAEFAQSVGATMVYLSTAGVFDGEKEGFYTEEDEPNPIMVYGRTKLDGEHHVRDLNERSYVIRAGWMVGGGRRKDKKFVYRMLQQIAEGRTVLHAVDDKVGTPTYTHDFAMNLFELLHQEDSYGTYHMVCEGYGSRYDVAREIVAICNRDDIDVRPVDSSFFQREYPTPRPRSEMLENAGLRALGINRMRNWKDALRAYVEEEYPEICREPTVAVEQRVAVAK